MQLERSQIFRGNPPTFINPDGGGAADILASESTLGGELGAIGQDVSNWFEKYLGRRLRIEWFSERYRLQLEPLGKNGSKTGFGVSVTDSGEGLMQALPLLVYLSLMKRGLRYDPSILAIEEPESHLHPRLHTAIAERIIEAGTSQSRKIVVETHSEIILLRIQRAIADGLPPANAIVYWLRQLENGKTTLEPIEFDELGRPIGNLPPMVFAEDSRQARLLLQKQRELIEKITPAES
jgi:predicted ATPase